MKKTDRASMKKTDRASMKKTDRASMKKTDRASMKKTDRVSAYPLHGECPVCGGRQPEARYTLNGFTIARCGGCSFLFVAEKLTPEQLTPFYETQESDPIYEDADNTRNLNHYYVRLKHIIEKRHPFGNLLDVGCSAGQFLDVMAGWNRYGIEFHSASSRMAQEKYGDRIAIGTLETAPFADAFFDVVTLQDVLDHFPDPMGSLGICRRLLKPGGTLIVKVHNMSCLYARLSGKRFYALIPPIHLSYFNGRNLALALNKYGFHVDASHFIPHLLYLKTIPYRLSRGNKLSLAYRAYQVLNRSPVGKIRVKKNLHDIITMVARRRAA